MDNTKVAIVGIVMLGVLILALLSYVFLVTHWEDIKSLALVSLVLGGTFSVAFCGWKLWSGR